MPSSRWGEEVTAFVVSTDGFDPEDLRRWIRRSLSGYKVPKQFHATDEIPRNPTGKILRTELVERATRLGTAPDRGDLDRS